MPEKNTPVTPSDGHDYELPAIARRDDGKLRHVGFELEFSGISLQETADVLCRVLHARPVDITAAAQKLHVDEIGDFQVELDWALLKKMAAEQADNDAEWINPLAEAATLLVPVEIACPPIALDRLGILDPMVSALREAGATGTEESFIAAYGVHINSEIPKLDPGTLQAYLQAFCLLQWWLVDDHAVDFSRRLSPYIDLYPQAYLKSVMQYDAADFTRIIDEYMEHNPTRNRALDLLPLLSEIDADRIREVIDDDRIQPRPAFHYRLPNCHIEKPDWSLHDAWSSWLVVERLASDQNALQQLADDFLAAHRPLLGVSRGDWVKYIDQWLIDHAWQ